ncbi:hypothetical protein ANCDUO_22767 [Ancylostoma duodenale]|uniref:Neurotransmitter-gated ion-channel ligand-binding domain-containing protein n=1 Tax=Ancylostoma duodenale TaxID=51022 RepID=A0A0C2FQE8_9BILA|nr:hypothetical protein ANCDUO_22767 [Ancylostoma duodenale]
MLVALGLLFLLLNLPRVLGQKEEIHYYDDPDVENEEMKQREVGATNTTDKEKISPSLRIAVRKDKRFQIDVQFIFHSVDHVVINEKEQVMTISGRYCMIWRDPHITWDPAKYNNLDTLHVGSYDVWTPRIIVLNGC